MKVPDIKEINQVHGSSGAQKAAPNRGRDRVSLTHTRAVEQAIAVSRERVSAARIADLERLEAAIQSGQYRPNAQQIAQRLLDEAELTAKLRAMLLR